MTFLCTNLNRQNVFKTERLCYNDSRQVKCSEQR
nr:MAG TPA: hypothetical protein [Caudoviricetes sp.]